MILFKNSENVKDIEEIQLNNLRVITNQIITMSKTMSKHIEYIPEMIVNFFKRYSFDDLASKFFQDVICLCECWLEQSPNDSNFYILITKNYDKIKNDEKFIDFRNNEIAREIELFRNIPIKFAEKLYSKIYELSFNYGLKTKEISEKLQNEFIPETLEGMIKELALPESSKIFINFTKFKYKQPLENVHKKIEKIENHNRDNFSIEKLSEIEKEIKENISKLEEIEIEFEKAKESIVKYKILDRTSFFEDELKELEYISKKAFNLLHNISKEKEKIHCIVKDVGEIDPNPPYGKHGINGQYVKKTEAEQKKIEEKIEERAKLFKSIPFEIAQNIVQRIFELISKGDKDEDFIYKEIKENYLLNYTESYVKPMVQTEISAIHTELIEFKCRKNNIPAYRWKTRDSKARKSHFYMSDVIIFWDDPPAPEDLFPNYSKKGKRYKNSLGHYHAGCCPNCRCVPDPIENIDSLNYPVKVYLNGKIKSMNEEDFISLYRIKAGLPQETQQQKEKREKIRAFQKSLRDISLEIERLEKEIVYKSDLAELKKIEEDVRLYIYRLGYMEFELKKIQTSSVIDKALITDSFFSGILAKIKETYKRANNLLIFTKRKIYIQEELENLEKLSKEKFTYSAQSKKEDIEKFVKNTLGIPKSDFSDIDIDVANEFTKCLINYFNIFPELRNRIKYVGSIQNSNSEIDSEFKKFGIDIGLKKRTIGMLESLSEEDIEKTFENQRAEMKSLKEEQIEYLKKFEKQYVGITINNTIKISVNFKIEQTVNSIVGFSPEYCNSLKSIIDHEFGHQLYKMLNLENNIEIDNLFNEEMLSAKLSFHAKKNKSEMVAEGWSEFCNNPEPSDFGLKIGKIIIEKYKNMYL